MHSQKQLQDVTNQVVLITGASSGLGEQLALQLAEQGAIIVGCSRHLMQLKKVIHACQKRSQRPAYAKVLDVSDTQAIDQIVTDVETNIGPIAILINAAGFGYMAEAINMSPTLTKQMFEVNVLGLMYLSQTVILKMAERKLGLIINIASMAGKVATPKFSTYAATKAAVIAYSNALRLELHPLGIHVLTVNPGPIKTNFFKTADPTGNYLASLGPLVLDPTALAKTIVKAIGTTKREINRPRYMALAGHGYQVLPKLGDFLTSTVFNKK